MISTDVVVVVVVAAAAAEVKIVAEHWQMIQRFQKIVLVHYLCAQA